MNYNKKSVEDIDVQGKRVLCRCDFNVPTKGGVITSDKRIVAALPTIEYLIKHGAKVILCSHLGRPKGEYKEEFSLAPVAARLSELLGQPVELAQDKEERDFTWDEAGVETLKAWLQEKYEAYCTAQK